MNKKILICTLAFATAGILTGCEDVRTEEYPNGNIRFEASTWVAAAFMAIIPGVALRPCRG